MEKPARALPVPTSTPRKTGRKGMTGSVREAIPTAEEGRRVGSDWKRCC